ncbi:hypothetical protein B0H13DRAFT_1882027 [Mycena leptocephala]|nr:hypothetical protein B0H13DRAFT_1882027 [Mycena leptocephala]
MDLVETGWAESECKKMETLGVSCNAWICETGMKISLYPGVPTTQMANDAVPRDSDAGARYETPNRAHCGSIERRPLFPRERRKPGVLQLGAPAHCARARSDAIGALTLYVRVVFQSSLERNPPSFKLSHTNMFSKLSVVVAYVLITLAATTPTGTPPSSPKRCYHVVSSTSVEASAIAALLDIDFDGLNVPIGLSCSPQAIDPLGNIPW